MISIFTLDYIVSQQTMQVTTLFCSRSSKDFSASMMQYLGTAANITSRVWLMFSILLSRLVQLSQECQSTVCIDDMQTRLDLTSRNGNSSDVG